VKRWSRYVLLASLAFLAVALYKADYLVIPRVYSIPALFAALACVLAGSIADALAWRKILEKSGFPVSVTESIAGVGLSVFAKYIPGKVWALMGRAAVVAERRSYSLAQVASASFTWQIVMIWLGVIFGAGGLVLLRAPAVWGWLVLVMWLALTAVLFSNAAQFTASGLYKRIFSRDISFPRMASRDLFISLPWFFVTWGVYSLGFYLLVSGLFSSRVPLSTGLGFPLSLTVGIIAFFAPGGLGVREGVLVGYLVLAGLPVQEATAISIAARLWVFVGEALIFLVGLSLGYFLKRKPPRRAGA
jgi:uncharacterized membrane protein YbhN (UPF0104 family)